MTSYVPWLCSFPCKQTWCLEAEGQLRAAEAIKPSTTSRCSMMGPGITLLDKKDLVTLSLPPTKQKKVAAAMLEWARPGFTESNRKGSLWVLSNPDWARAKVIVL